MSSSTLRELEAQIAELEAMIASSPPDQAALLQQSLQSARQAADMLRRIEGANPAPAARPPLHPEVAAFFRPEPPAPVPAWLPDGLTRADVTEPMLRCPPGARVYVLDNGFSCAIAGQAGVRLSAPHGLSIGFHPTGRLASQRFYEHGLCRWSVEHHPNGARSQVGFYADQKEKDFVEHGLHTQYSLDGVVKSQATFWYGVRHGWSKQWEDDGYPIIATLYENGRAVEQVTPDGARQRL